MLSISLSHHVGQYYDQDSFYSQFVKDVRSCRSELLIESAFLTVKRVQVLAPLLDRLVKRGVMVNVNTRSPDEHDDFMCDQALLSVELLQSIGIQVLYTTGLHRKLAIIDNEVVWQGSLNILSQSESCELMRRDVSTSDAEMLLNFIGLKRYLQVG